MLIYEAQVVHKTSDCKCLHSFSPLNSSTSSSWTKQNTSLFLFHSSLPNYFISPSTDHESAALQFNIDLFFDYYNFQPNEKRSRHHPRVIFADDVYQKEESPQFTTDRSATTTATNSPEKQVLEMNIRTIFREMQNIKWSAIERR